MILSPTTGPPLRRSVRAPAIAHALTPEQEADAYDLIDRAHAIATKPDPPGPSMRRGAFLERLVIELLAWRGVPDIREEVSFRFAERISACIDVVGMTDEVVEIFECKTIPDELKQVHLDELATVGELAETDPFPKTVLPTVATLWPREELSVAMTDNGLTSPAFRIYRSTLETILGLSVGPATDPLS